MHIKEGNIGIPNKVFDILQQVYANTNPQSIFLYGSSAVGDTVANKSDYEVGLIYDKATKISRSELAKTHNLRQLSLYPFASEDLEIGFIDTIFPQKLYLYQIKLGSKTIFGKDILSNLVVPKLSLSDLLESVAFECGIAMAAYVNFRNVSVESATSYFVKSCLYTVRTLIIFQLGIFPISYKEIVELVKSNSGKLNLSEDEILLINNSYEIRNGRLSITNEYIFQNLKLVNKVKNIIQDKLQNSGDRQIFVK